MTHPFVKRRRRVNLILTLLALLGIFCLAMSVSAYNDTIISFKIPFIIFICASLIGFAILRRFNVMHGVVARTAAEGSKFRRQLAVMIYAIFIFGTTGVFIFFIANEFASDNIMILDAPIQKKTVYTYSDGRTTYSVFFEMMGDIRAKSFDEDLHAEVDAANSIQVTYKNGYWGSFVINNYKLNE